MAHYRLELAESMDLSWANSLFFRCESIGVRFDGFAPKLILKRGNEDVFTGGFVLSELMGWRVSLAGRSLFTKSLFALSELLVGCIGSLSSKTLDRSKSSISRVSSSQCRSNNASFCSMSFFMFCWIALILWSRVNKWMSANWSAIWLFLQCLPLHFSFSTIGFIT